MNESHRKSNPGKGSGSPSPVDRLAELLRLRQTIPYHENIADKEYPNVTCSVYGAPETNELFVKLTNGTVTFVDVEKSDLLHPPMADRIFGMDVADHHTAFSLATRMWEKRRDALVPNTQK